MCHIRGHDYTIGTLDALKACDACATMGQLYAVYWLCSLSHSWLLLRKLTCQNIFDLVDRCSTAAQYWFFVCYNCYLVISLEVTLTNHSFQFSTLCHWNQEKTTELVHCTTTDPCLCMHHRLSVRTLQHVTVSIRNIYRNQLTNAFHQPIQTHLLHSQSISQMPLSQLSLPSFLALPFEAWNSLVSRVVNFPEI